MQGKKGEKKTIKKKQPLCSYKCDGEKVTFQGDSPSESNSAYRGLKSCDTDLCNKDPCKKVKKNGSSSTTTTIFGLLGSLAGIGVIISVIVCIRKKGYVSEILVCIAYDSIHSQLVFQFQI